MTIELSGVSNGFELARYMLKYAQNLEKMVVVYHPRQSKATRKLKKVVTAQDLEKQRLFVRPKYLIL